jgi:type VI secretion system protein ImpG
MESLLPYFERELVSLRRLFREFNERYPKVGGRLQLGSDICPDPHVEQLIESVALIAARVAKRLDDGYPELTEGLLESLFPHYLLPFPSCTIVRATFPLVKAAGVRPVLQIPRGTELRSDAVQGVPCQFRTAYDITLAPVALSKARFDASIRVPAGMALPPAANACVSIALEGEGVAQLDRTRVYIDGESSFCACLRDALFMRTVCAYIEVVSGAWTALPQIPLAPAGFAEDDALIPFGARSHPAYRGLSEFFAFPEKFNFFDIDLAALRRHLPPETRQFTLHLAMSGIRPDSDTAHMLASLRAENLLLGCSPAINLFQRAGLPVAVTHFSADYGIVADASRPAAFEVYSIDSVRMIRRQGSGKGQREAITEFRPFYALRHGEQIGNDRHYWVSRTDGTVATASPGHEKRITLVDADFDPAVVEKTSLSVGLTCTNRDLPVSLGHGGAGGRMTALHDADTFIVQSLRKPTPQYRFGSEPARHWRLISHLTLNHHALTRDGLPAFREMLLLYDLPQSAISRRQIDGIVALDQVETVSWLRHKYGTSLVHGLEVRLTLDEEAFVGSGMHLFVEVIDQFLGLYVQVNSFIELVVLSKQSGKELLRCKPRNGYLKPV